VVVHTDLNCLSVLQYAVDVLHVEHVIVVGHYGCGGIRAALAQQALGLIDNWLRHVQDVADRHADSSLRSTSTRASIACASSTSSSRCSTSRERRSCRTPGSAARRCTLHGWVYGISDGLVKDLRVEADSVAKLEADYQAALAAVARSGR
jgi:carbonic anhydrase